MAPNTLRYARLMLARCPDAKALVIDGVTIMCPMDNRQEIVDDGSGAGVKQGEIVVRVSAETTAPSREKRITYDGIAYTVRDTLRQENGDFLLWQLVPVAP